ncbi:MAG: 30S ribosomal protein S2 [uncultured bacterium]|nr:MAG: 30S ribosomal protein S2 [uncultured bacterium]
MSVKIPEIKEMFLAGMHFGHKKEHSHPKAKEYIFGLRDGVNVIDLTKTQEFLKLVLEFIVREVKIGKVFLFVGTKKQIKQSVKDAAVKSEMPYIAQRWLGGILTNFETIRKGIKYLEDSEAKIADESSDLTKKERTLLDKEVNKQKEIYDGIRKMKELPDYLLIIDPVKEHNAVSEAKKKHIPIVAVCDTDANPNKVDWFIPANDDAKSSVEIVMNLIAETIVGAKKDLEKKSDKVVEDKKDTKTEKSEE